MQGLRAGAVKLALLMFVVHGVAAQAAEVNVFAPTTIRAVMNELGPQFERATGHRLAIKYDTAPVMKRQIDSGQAFDLAILTRPLIDETIKQGKIVATTRADVGRAGAGVAIRKGAPRPDVGSIDAFRHTLLNAKSIAYAAEGTTGAYFLGLLDRLGIAAEAKPKLKPMGGGGVVAPVASGEAEIAVVTTPLILEDPRVELAGSVPAELQNYIVFTAGVGTAAKEADAAGALIRLLTAPAAAPVLRAKGFEPPGQ
jgi:molybdate transport system substrate-binding protein